MDNRQLNISDIDLYSPYRGANVAVLGASGFIGRWIARELCQLGANVYLFIRDGLTANKVFKQYGIQGNIIELNLEDSASELIDVFHELKPVITFNLAGYGVDRSERADKTAYKVNADLVKTICEAVAKVKSGVSWPGQDIIHVGSALEYGDICGDLAENFPAKPTTLYGESKLAGTRLLTQCCHEYKLRGMTVRLFTVYGPGEHAGRLLPSLIDAAHKGSSLPLTTGVQKRDFTYIDDVTEGLLRLGLVGESATESAGQGSIVNLASGQLTSVKEFVVTAARVLNIDNESLCFGAIPSRSEEMQHLPVSNKRLQQLAHWIPTISIEEGVRRCSDF